MNELSYKERSELFWHEVPVGFLQAFVQDLRAIYRETYDEYEDHPLPYQRAIRPYHIRLRVELAALSRASEHGLTARIGLNLSRDAHAVILSTHALMTISKTDSPLRPPRRARFRRTYAGWGGLGQTVMPELIPDVEDPILLDLDNPPVYVLLSHGPNPREPRELGFLWANFPAPWGGYRGPGIDVLSMLAKTPALPMEQPLERPTVRLRDTARKTGNASNE